MNNEDDTRMQLLRFVALLIIAASVIVAMAIRNLRTLAKEFCAYAGALFQAVLLLI